MNAQENLVACVERLDAVIAKTESTNAKLYSDEGTVIRRRVVQMILDTLNDYRTGVDCERVADSMMDPTHILDHKPTELDMLVLLFHEFCVTAMTALIGMAVNHAMQTGNLRALGSFTSGMNSMAKAIPSAVASIIAASVTEEEEDKS